MGLANVIIREELGSLRVSERVKELDNNCKKLLFVYEEIERIKRQLKNQEEITYRQLKRKNLLGVSQYLLDSAEKIVPLIKTLPLRVQKKLIERGGKWSIKAISKAVNVPEKALVKILNMPVKPTANYIAFELGIEGNYERWKLPILEEYWWEIEQKYQLSSEHKKTAQKMLKQNTVSDLLDCLSELGFDIKQLSFYQTFLKKRKMKDLNFNSLNQRKSITLKVYSTEKKLLLSSLK